MKISCSARKDWQFHIKDWLDYFCNHAKIHSNFQFNYKDIDYVFGKTMEFTSHYSPDMEGQTQLWGGRIASSINLTILDIYWLYNKGIGIKFPLSNKFVTYEQYKKSKPFLKKYHRKGNAIITATDELAKHIKNDFPDYQIEASCIQDIVSAEKLEQKISLG